MKTLLGVLLVDSGGSTAAQRDDRRVKNGGGKKEASSQQSSHADEVHAAWQGEDCPQRICCTAGIVTPCLTWGLPVNCDKSIPAHTSPGLPVITVDTALCAVLRCAGLSWAVYHM